MSSEKHVALPFSFGPISSEFAELDLGDARRNDRGGRIAESWASSPEVSLPQAMRSPAEIEAAYRFFNNKDVHAAAICAPHVSETWRRASEASSAGWILSLEDTTELRFGGVAERQGLGSLMNDGQGFYAHVALLVALVDGEPGCLAVPLGVGASEFVVRPRTADPALEKLSKKQRERMRHFRGDNEALRWHRTSEAVDRSARDYDLSLVHVGDRELDKFPWLAELRERGSRFVVRQTHNRRLAEGSDEDARYLEDLLAESLPVLATRCVRFESAFSSGGRRRRKEARKGRETQLEVRATTATIRRPQVCRSDAAELTVNIVQVREVDPPEGGEPIEWRLLTTEPIATEEEVLRVVDAYRARWLIEEFFKAIKTGCNYERLQFQTRHALQNALALCMALAWHLLLVRSIARDAPRTPARAVLTESQFALLTTLARRDNPWGVKLPTDPTARDASLAIARMGGHFKHNGPPGWLTLARGFRELDRLEAAQRLLAPDL